METTLTQRDKALLIILGIILVVFAAVMVPNYGIYALITTSNELKTEINTQKNENEQALTALVSSGISAASAENGSLAKTILLKAILSEQHQLAKLSLTLESSKSYATAKEWLEPVKYVDYTKGGVELFADLSVSQNDSGFESAELTMGDVSYRVDMYRGEIGCNLIDGDAYILDADHLQADESYLLGSYIVLIDQLVKRGSIIIKDFEYSTTTAGGNGQITVPIEIYVPENNQIAYYASTVCECHSCGNPYYLSVYEEFILNASEGEIYTCPNCDAEIYEEDALPIG